MPRNWKCLLLAVSLVSVARGEKWAPIPPEVWALKEDPSKGIKDAIVLENRTRFTFYDMERTLRVRVLSEAGRKALELPEFSEDCHDFSGRTVYPDEKILAFDKSQDFHRETYEVGDYSIKTTMVIPPGVTRDCVVELRWQESTAFKAGSPLPARMGYQTVLPFGSAYQTLLQTVELCPKYEWAYSMIPGKTIKMEVAEKSGFKIMSVRNIPPIATPPYSLSVSMDRPVFMTYFQFGDPLLTAGSGGAYWTAVAKGILISQIELGIRKKRNYQQLKEKLFQQIEVKTPHLVAIRLATLLEKEILNISRMTHEEYARFPKDLKSAEVTDLESACEKKIASEEGLLVLYYHLLADAGYKPKIALLVDRERGLFRPDIRNPWQARDEMIAVEEPEKGLALVDPSLRFAQPGMILPNYQGLQGLLVDPKAEWATQVFQVPVQSPQFNQKRYEYALTVGEEGDRFLVKAQFCGYPEYSERRSYMMDEPAEQNRKLKERFEKQIKGGVITQAEVLDATDPTKNITWTAEGILERESSRQRKVEPFPGLPSPLDIPDSFPKERTLPIVMPYLQVQSFQSTFRIPKGYRLNECPPFDQKNTFGHVIWGVSTKAEGADTIATVSLKISVEGMFAAPSAYEDLKTYLGWVSETSRRIVVLEKR